MQQIPLPERADEITAEWMRQALTTGGTSDFPEIDALEIEKLSDVTNALGNLFRCRLSARDGTAAYPASVIVKFPTSDALALRFAKWLSLHRREYVFYRDIAPHGNVRVPSLTSIAAALSLVLALFFRVRSGPTPGDANDIDGEQQR